MTEATAEVSVRRRRASAQGLLRPVGLEAPDVVRHLVAVQAQDHRSARLALRARIPGLRAEDLDASRDLVVTWLLRGTLHLVHREDLPWLHALAPPPPARRLEVLGVDDGVVARVAAALPFTRSQAPEALGLAGQAVPYALRLAAHRGVCVSDLAGRFVAAAIPEVPRADAAAELARRYAAAHPGATRADLAAWSGLPHRVLGVDPSPRAGEGSDPSPVPPRLLPAFDPYLLGWRDRSFAVPPAWRARVSPGGGMFRATATLDGAVVGTWTAPRGRVVLDGGDPALFAEEVADVERVLATGPRPAP